MGKKKRPSFREGLVGLDKGGLQSPCPTLSNEQDKANAESRCKAMSNRERQYLNLVRPKPKCFAIRRELWWRETGSFGVFFFFHTQVIMIKKKKKGRTGWRMNIRAT